MRLYVASSNAGKLTEFRRIAGHHGVFVDPIPGLEDILAPAETGSTFETNARLKAAAYSRHVPGCLVIADDSGLEVEALDGAPGVLSARYSARDKNHKPADRDNNYKLLQELHKLPDAPRTARFVCVIALAKDSETIETFRGEAHGEILQSPLGRHGFGYDPLFYVPEANKTFAEMKSDEKSKYSHRGAAFRKLLEYLAQE